MKSFAPLICLAISSLPFYQTTTEKPHLNPFICFDVGCTPAHARDLCLRAPVGVFNWS